MSKLSPETFKALLALESAFGQVESVSELKAELSATFPDGARALRFGSEDYPSVLEDLADPQKYSAPAVIFRLQSGSFECQLWVRVMHLLIDAKLPNSSQLIWRPAEPLSFLG